MNMVMSSTLGAARQTMTFNKNPGPGAYKTHYESILRSNPKAIIGSSKRTDLNPKDIINTPGPSNYLPNIDAVKRTSTNWTMKTAKRYDTPDGTSRGKRNNKDS